MASIQELWKPSSSTSTSMLELAGLLLGLWGEEEGTRDGEDESSDEGVFLGDLLVTPASRTVRAGSAARPPGNIQIFIWMVVGPTCHSSLPPHSVQSRGEHERSRRRRLLPSISLLRPPNLDSSRGNLPRHLLQLPQPLDRLLTAKITPTTTGHHWRCLKLCSTSIRFSGRPPLEPTAGMDSW